MRLKKEEKGQVENFCIDKDQICSCDRAFVYDSLTQLQEAGWKDYKEPDFFYYIDGCECRIVRSTYEVIGNIHENPELFKGGKNGKSKG